MRRNTRVFMAAGLVLSLLIVSYSNAIAARDGGYDVTADLWAKAVLKPANGDVTLIWQMVGAAITPSGAQVISGYFYADPNDFLYGSLYNPEVFVKIYIDPSGWCNIAFNHVTVDNVEVSSAYHYESDSGGGDPGGGDSGGHQLVGSVTKVGLVSGADYSATITTRNRLIEHEYTGVSIDNTLSSSGLGEGVAVSAGDGGYILSSDLWCKAVLEVPGSPVTLIWKEVGSDTTPSGDRVVSGYFYADPSDFVHGSAYNPEVFVKVYITSSGWANIAFNHVTVADVTTFSAQQYASLPNKTESVNINGRLKEHQYDLANPQPSDTSAPTTPTGLSAAAVSPSRIDLSWTASTDNIGVTGYQIYRNGSYLKSSTSASTSDEPLNPSTQYCYTVVAYDDAGNASSQSGQSCATTSATQDTTAPTTPSGLSASAVSSSRIDLSWTVSTDNVGVAGYRIYRGGVYLKSVTSTSASDEGLNPSTQYCYNVSAYDTAGNVSSQSGQACATTTAAPDTTNPSVSINSPTTGSSYSTGSSTLNISGSASDNVGVTQVTWSNNRGGNGTCSGTTSWSKSGMTLYEGQNIITVTARDAAGNTASETLTVTYTAPDTTAPTTPTGLSATAVSSSRIDLSWSASTDYVGVSGYHMYRNGTYLKSVTATSTSDINLSASTQYCYTVSAYDVAGNLSGQSGQACATTYSSGPSGQTYTNSLGMTFNLIPAGTFTMGSPSSELGRNSIEETQHQVTLTQSYYMQTTEVTQGQWRSVMGSNPSYFANCGDNCPVESVSWDDIQSFITAMNQRGEGTYRLPTEAEWEYAARAGSTSAFANGGISVTVCSYDPNLDAMGWYCGNSDVTYAGCCDCSSWGGPPCAGTHPVGGKQPNAWGLYDMHGNVFEWCQDWYDSYPTGAVTNPTGPSSGSYRVLRGGSWDFIAGYCRSANRYNGGPGDRYYDDGLRLVALPGQ